MKNIGFSVISILIAVMMLSIIKVPVSAEGVNCADTATTGISQSECEALVALYNSTNGSSWTNHDNWLTNAPVSEWHGVTVSGGHVAGQLNLSYNNLSGPIPPEIGNLSYVNYFYFPDNQLTGEIPVEIANVTGLLYLYLPENELTGEIPIQLFSLPSIKDLILSSNHLSGQIPAEVGNATTLKRFMVNDNELVGELPVEMANLTSLTHLTIGGNDLYGVLPAGLADWPTSMSLFDISSSGFWTTDSDLLTFLDTLQPGWENGQSSQALEPSQNDFVGWGALEDSTGFSPKFVFSKFFYRSGNAAEKYLIQMYKADNTKILEVERNDAQVCPEGGAEITAVCTFIPQWSDFTEPPSQGEYYWAVYVSDGSGWDWSDKNHDFKIVNPPAVNYPTSITSRVNPTFKWGTTEAAVGYNLWVMDSGSGVVFDDYMDLTHCAGSICTFAPTLTDLNLVNGSYTWMVRADMGGGDYTDWGDATFTKVAAPAARWPSVTTTMPNPKIIWAPVSGQTRYQVQLYTSAGVKKLDQTFTTSVCTATACTYAPTTAVLNLVNGAYKWKVRAGDAVEWGTFSAYKTFNKVSPPAGVSPTGTITATNPTFKWKKIAGATKYYLELRKSSGVIVKVVTISAPVCTSTTCSYTFAPALNLAKGDYMWHVKAFNGYYGPYGAYMTFKRQ